ncbi:MAG: class I SAM-dependent methyltransferase [Hydrococcus sp. Prado102]|jgi:ubiquinone/menaquinone biosynthesis C-methylase UbiE|nr:class I SAM-dependent methyltransferase [Hydrococcus sp. Prado102]
MIQKGLRRQPGKPTGIVGRIVGYIMDIYNREDNHWTSSLLEISETSKVLEVGFGTGLAIADAAKITTRGHVYGIELSQTMLQVAQKRNQNAIKSDRVSLQLGNVMALPFEDNYFDCVYSINCIYFWEPPTQGLAEIYRVLKPEGTVAITARNKDNEVYARWKPHLVRDLLQSSGFVDVKPLNGLNPKHPIYCAIGTKPFT